MVADANAISLAVWDVPMPVVAGQRFAIKVGAKRAGARVEVSDSAGTILASGTLGEAPWPGTEALYWVTVAVPAPDQDELAEYAVRLAGRAEPSVATRFSVVATARPEHLLSVTVTEQNTKAALEGVEIRLGPFHARTDKDGRAEVRVCQGGYRLQLWRNGHIAPAKAFSISADITLELTMVHVPEDHPDARWVR